MNRSKEGTSLILRERRAQASKIEPYNEEQVQVSIVQDVVGHKLELTSLLNVLV